MPSEPLFPAATRLGRFLRWLFFVAVPAVVLIALKDMYDASYAQKHKDDPFFVFSWLLGLTAVEWLITIVILGGGVAFVVWANHRDRIAAFKSLWEVCKDAQALTKEDLGIERPSEAYIHRSANARLDELIAHGKNILVKGRPALGKTRAVFEGLHQCEDAIVIKPFRQSLSEKKIGVPFAWRKRRLICLLDDLHEYIESDITALTIALRRASNVQFIATCRTGDEMRIAKEKMSILSVIKSFDELELEDISREQSRWLAEQVGVEWSDEDYDGAPGTVIVGLRRMIEKYGALKEPKMILWAMRLLYDAGLTLFREDRLRLICERLFEYPAAGLHQLAWSEMVRHLVENGFIRHAEGKLHAHPIILERCVSPFDSSQYMLDLRQLIAETNDPLQLYQLGLGHMRRQEFHEARKCFEETLVLADNAEKVFIALASAITHQADRETRKGDVQGTAVALYQDAEAVYRRGLKVAPHSALLRNGLAYTLTNRAEQLKATGDREGFERLLQMSLNESQKALSIDSKYAAALRTKAFAVALSGRIDEALKYYEDAITLNPLSPFAHNLSGNLLKGQGHLPEAIKHFRTALSLTSHYPTCRTNLGKALIEQGEYVDACVELEKATTEDPEYFSAHLNLGIARSYTRDFEGATKSLNAAIQLNPNSGDAYSWLGGVRSRDKDPEGCFAAFERSIELRPENLHTRILYAKSLDFFGKTDKAIEVIDAVLDLSQTNAEALQLRATFEGKVGRHIELTREGSKAADAGDLEKAERLLRKALELAPEDAECIKNWARLLEMKAKSEQDEGERRRMLEDCVVHYTHAIDLDPHYPSGIRHLANVLLALGRDGDARTWYLFGVEKVKNYPKLHRDFGLFLARHGDSKAAREEFVLAVDQFRMKSMDKERKECEEYIRRLDGGDSL